MYQRKDDTESLGLWQQQREERREQEGQVLAAGSLSIYAL